MTLEYAEDATNLDETLHLDGFDLHIVGEQGDVEVWLNTKVADFDGIAIGGGETRGEAVRDAIETLGKALKTLKEKL